MPPMIIVAAAIAVVLLVIALVVVRSKGKAEPEAPRFQPPTELAPQKPKDQPAPVAQSAAPTPPPATSTAPSPPSGQFPAPTPLAAPVEQILTPPIATPAITAPPPSPAVAVEEEEEEIQEHTAAMPAPPIPEPKIEAKPAAPAKPVAPAVPGKPRAPLRSYSSINDEPDSAEPKPVVEAKAPPPKPLPLPKLSEPKVPVVAPPPQKVSTGKMAAAKVPVNAEHDFSALNESKPKIPVATPPEPKPAPVAEAKPVTAPPAAEAKPAQTAASAIAAKYMQPSNPATAELEKNDPRHAAARRLARLSVSEIKLYHEDEVKTGRESKDLWTRLQTDIGLARQTFDSRVVAEVRDRFDYLLDEIVRQLAEGDASKLGAGAPALKTDASAAAAAPAAAAPAPAPEPVKAEVPAPPPTPKPVPEAPKSAPKAEPKPEPKPAAAGIAAVAAAVAPPAEAAAKPSGLAARMLPSNPETAELEKSDPRHAAARRLARLSVSEIKLYHEAEVTAGRENKDIWTRLQTDIALATQTFEKRVDKEIRDRFDYLYDEVLRQLAEGDVAKLGPNAPAPKKAAEAPAPAPAPVAAAPAAAAPADAPAAATPTPAPAAAAPAPTPAAPTAASAIAAKYMQPANPATAELEKSDPRHAAARRFARLSVSEIKLYHEDEVKAGREAKDLWTRMSTDIGLATQTYEKRVDKEVRDRFDYLYDEILRQLGEGDAAKLGPNAPKPNQ